MFIYLERLIQVENIQEEIYLIPQPRYFKVNSNKKQINEDSRIITD